MAQEAEAPESPENGAETSDHRIPPYVSYKTFRTFLDDLKTHGLPDRIDRTVLERFSGSVRKQLVGALRWLGLVGEADRPTHFLKLLSQGFGTDEYGGELRLLLARTFTFVDLESLERMTPGQLAEAFRTKYRAQDAVLRKCQTFFLQAAQEAGVPINARILKRTRAQTSAAPRRRSAPRTQLEQQPRAREPQPPPPPVKPASPFDVLIGILDPKRMQEEEQAAVWTLIRYLKKQEVSV